MSSRRLEDAGAWLEAQGKLAALATTMREGGWSPQDAARALNGLNARSKTHAADELKRLVRDAYSVNGTAKTAKVPSAKPPGLAGGTFSKLHRLDVAAMVRTKPPAVDFLVEGIVARGEVTQLWGAPGLGKSLCSEAFARGVALGEPVAGLQCKQGHVAYIDAENGQWEIHRRVNSLGLPPEVAIYDALGLHLVEDVDEIRVALEAEPPDLVVLDSYRRLTPGWEENDSGDAALAIATLKGLAQEFECGVLLIHHAKKDGTDSRGSSALKDQVSISWKLARADGDYEKSRRVLHNDKMRVAAEPDDIHLRIVFDESGSVDVVAADAPEPVDRLASGKQRAPLAAEILDALDDGGAMKKPAIAKALGIDPTHGTFRRALDDLVDRGQVVREGRTYQKPPPATTQHLAAGTLADATKTASGGKVAAAKAKRPRTRP